MIKSVEIQRPYPLGHGGRLYNIVDYCTSMQDSNVSRVVRKPAFCICEADQCLCFRYTDMICTDYADFYGLTFLYTRPLGCEDKTKSSMAY